MVVHTLNADCMLVGIWLRHADRLDYSIYTVGPAVRSVHVDTICAKAPLYTCV